MPVYRYTALDADQKVTTGVIEAANAKDARVQLLGGNLYLLDLDSATGGTAVRRNVALSKRSANELALVTRQFATLAKAGIPLADALAALADVIEDPRLQITFRDVKENVTHGMSLAEALKRHPRHFSPLYVSMVKVGEASGNMTLVLNHLSDYLHTHARLRTKVKQALTYPVLMLTVGAFVVGFLLAFVIPRITDMLLESGKALPVPTVMLIGLSGFLGRFWWAIAAALAGLYAAYRAAVATERGALARDAFVLAAPVAGTLLKKSLVSRFAMTFATLLRAGLPAVESLAIVKETVGNKVLEATIGAIHDRIIEGQDIAEIMKRGGVFPPLVAYMIAVGEKSGRLEEMLGIVNEYYDEEIEAATARFTSVLEPVMIIALALIVGFVVMGVILPILDMGKIV
ncbi:MAG TPA: type II secretion system F family protein [Planctomycetota bacterium]|jgi:general secretion pathway protein F|nr:type II secretion system F family protein [Planctomycetota bacterium]OQC21700.1 MAG: Type II secretion system protein F [Planctomycetes bacterium ADurb.Bin069]NMD36643.1 type II secretion system protein GspF [Planctomycetota bacterium]HNR98920.1 type II secretion system F family protein [Planctomycetota bacterium]HNU26005.1 type II secretion system F family protein [Planctomycetota bacterium]